MSGGAISIGWWSVDMAVEAVEAAIAGSGMAAAMRANDCEMTRCR
jgi:hypothetical protein